MPDAQFTVPYPEHPHFVGREEDLARLHAALQREGPVGITGQGGIGKTQLAVAYAYKYRDDYPDGVYWLNAANEWRVAFAKLADDLNLPAAGSASSLGIKERQDIVKILAAKSGLQAGPAARAAFLGDAGLSRFISSLDLSGAAGDVAKALVTRLEPFGVLPDQPTHHALGALLEYVAGLDDTPIEDGRWLREVIGRYRLIATAATPQSQDERIIAAFAWLQEHPQSLLILDNVTDPVALDEPLTRDCVPARLPGRVMFTTRRRDAGHFRLVELKALLPDAALKLLLRDSRRRAALNPAHPEHAIAQDVCATFGYLPLALEIAAAHLAKFHSAPLAAYRGELRRRGALDVMADRHVPVATRHETGLAAALAAQWATLGEEAQMVLRVAGQLPEAAYVPTARLGLLAGVPEEGQSFFDVTLDVALNELNDASFIEELAGDQIRLHPLVREFARDRTPLEKKAAFRGECARRLLTTFSDITTLERQCDRRGIDMLIYDFLAAKGFLDSVPDEATLSTLRPYLQILRREAHNLRGWRRSDAPTFLCQQLHIRRLNSKTPSCFGDLVAHLNVAGSSLIGRWAASGEPSELEMTLTGHEEWVHAVTVMADGCRAISSGYDGTLRLWNLDTGASERILTDHEGRVRSVAVTHDGHRAISGGRDGTVRVWNLSTGECQWKFTEHEGEVYCVAVTPKGQRAISGGGDGTVRIWNLDTGTQEWAIPAHHDEVVALTLTSDGRWAISGGGDGLVKVWDLEGRTVKWTIADYSGEVIALALTIDGKRLVVGAGNKVVIWNIDTRKAEAAYDIPEGWVRTVAIAAEGQRVVAGIDNKVCVWNLNTDEAARILVDQRWVYAVALTLDGQRVISGSEDGTLRVWNLDVGTAEPTATGHSGGVRAIAPTADGRLAISGGKDGILHVWDLAEGRIERSLSGHMGWVYAVVLTPDEKQVLSGGDNGELRRWNLETGKSEIWTGHTGSVYAVAVTPDGQRAVSGGDDGTLVIWDLTTGMSRPAATGHQGPVFGIAVMPDGQLVVSSGRDGVKVWNLDTGASEQAIAGPRDWASAVAVTPGAMVLSGKHDGSLQLLNPYTGDTQLALSGHKGAVKAVAIVSGGRRAVSGGSDGTLRMWNLDTGRELARAALDAGITCLGITPTQPPFVVAGDAAGGVYCLEWIE